MNKITENKYHRLYKRHVKNLTVEPDSGLAAIGNSPITEGLIKVFLDDGGFHCLNSGKYGSFYEFQKELYPTLTLKGGSEAFDKEGSSFYPENDLDYLDKNYVNKKLIEFRSTVDSSFFDYYGLDPETVQNMPVWKDSNLNFHYIYTSHTGEPLCKYSWTNYGPYEEYPRTEVFGAPRLRQTNHQQIYFVHDPVRAELLQRRIDSPVYVRPTTNTFLFNDYQRLIDGKEVICCIPDKSSSSFLPEDKEVKMASNNAIELLDIYEQNHPMAIEETMADVAFSEYIDSVNQFMEMYVAVGKYEKSKEATNN